MSNFTKTTDFSAKDGLTTGDPNKIVSGTEIDVEFDNIATSSATKANKKVPVTTGNLTTLDASGDLGDSGFKLSGVGGIITADAAEINKTNTTASQGDLDAVTNFEETISATTSEVTIKTAKTLNITDVGGLKIGGVTLSGTAAEYNICDNPNTANKALKLDANALIPVANLPYETYTGSFTSVVTGGIGADILTLTNITTVYGVSLMVYNGTTSYINQPNYLVRNDDGFWSTDDRTKAWGSYTLPVEGELVIALYNNDSVTRTLQYKLIVFGTI